ncbi:probably inactive leucine-rich repeat receptor-like protein kinase [Tanacetum coccineum]
MVLNLFQDSLPHVRLSAINSTGRLSTNLDQDLQFQYHNHVPALATAISDFIHEFRCFLAESKSVTLVGNSIVSNTVHHGGAGTTAAGLKVACPTTVVPFFRDQPSVGTKYMLGGRPLQFYDEELLTKKVISAIGFMLKPAVKVSATELAKAMANENGVKGVVDAQPLFNETVSRLHLIFKSWVKNLINKGDFQLAWIFRLKIAIGITQGLPYLHKDYVPHLLHRDVKSRNVLLNNEFKPKLTDLALDTILEFGYNKKATEQMDTYVFGVRRKVNISNGSVQVLDQKNSSSCKQEALGMLEIALQCTSVVPGKQPSIWEVVAALQYLGSKTRVPENGVKINLMCERIQVSMREI